MSRDHGFAYRPALDGLRAVSVLAVMAYHLGYGWVPGGFLGVDAFFVLSGYLITSLLLGEHDRRGRIHLPAFWTRRARRLLPAVLLVLVAVSVYAATWVPAIERGSLRGDGLGTLFYAANWRLIRSGQSYFDLFSSPSPLRHMWSLAIEEQFYLVWPLLTAGALRIGRGRRGVLAALCAGGAAASALLMAALYDRLDPSRAYYGTDARAHALLVGCLLAVVLERWRPGARAARVLDAGGAAAAVVVLLAFARVGDRDPFMYRGGFLGYAAVVAVLVAAGVQPGWSPLRAALSWGPLRWIGTISYGLYLWHWPVDVALTPGRVGVDGAALDAVRTATTFAVAAVSFYAVERPVRYGGLGRVRPLAAAPVAMALVGGVIVVGTAGAEAPPAIFDTSAPITAPPPPSSTVPPDPSDTAAPRDTRPRGRGAPTTAPAPAARGPVTVAVVGDSVAGTLQWGLEALASEERLTIVSATYPGCGVAAGLPVDDRGEPFEWSEACAENIGPAHERMIAEHDPAVVVWLSTWELSDRLEGDRVVRYGTPEGDAALREDLEEARARLTAGGAHLLLLSVVPNAESDRAPADDDGDGRIAHYNEMLADLAAEDRDTTFVDLGAIVCPGGPPCPTEVDGVRLRPDGGHFTEETSVWVARRILPRLLSTV